MLNMQKALGVRLSVDNTLLGILYIVVVQLLLAFSSGCGREYYIYNISW